MPKIPRDFDFETDDEYKKYLPEHQDDDEDEDDTLDGEDE